jgi:hypothetical protein
MEHTAYIFTTFKASAVLFRLYIKVLWKEMMSNTFHRMLVREVHAVGTKSVDFKKHLPFYWSVLHTRLMKATLKA